MHLDTEPHLTVQASWLELLFIAAKCPDVIFPAACPRTGDWIAAADVPLRLQLMTAVMLRIVRTLVCKALKVVNLQALLCDDVDMRMGGVLWGISSCRLNKADAKLVPFSRARPIRAKADLSLHIRCR